MERIWLKSYPPDVPEMIDIDQYPSLVAALDDFCQTYSENIAFSNFGSNITYRQLHEYSVRLAGYLQDVLRLKSGERVAIMMPNLLQYPISILAILRAGLVVVNINPLYTARELRDELKNSGAKAIIVLENYASSIEKVLNDVMLEQVIVTRFGDLLGSFKGMIYNWAVKYIKRLVPNWKIANVHYFQTAIAASSNPSGVFPAITADNIAFLQYTGGTTGLPKGAVLTHRNVLANLLQCKAWMSGTFEPGKEILIAPLPLYHIFSLIVSCFAFLALGGRCLLITDPRDIPSFIKIWRTNKPTCFVGLNTLMVHLMKNPAFSKIDFSCLKLTVTGGMSTQRKVAEQWRQITGTVVIEGYGLTEASPVVTINPLTIENFNQSIGLPVPSTEVKICDQQQHPLNIDEVGELWVKGPQVMKEYWQNEIETFQVLTSDGWLRTGDLAWMDAQGFLFLKERLKDMIIVSGFNVYPSEVESIINLHPGVSESAVVGVPSPDTGEVVTAFIVKKDPNLTAEMIIKHCHQQLTAYKVPKRIVFKDSLPKSSVGKTLRRALQEELR